MRAVVAHVVVHGENFAGNGHAGFVGQRRLGIAGADKRNRVGAHQAVHDFRVGEAVGETGGLGVTNEPIVGVRDGGFGGRVAGGPIRFQHIPSLRLRILHDGIILAGLVSPETIALKDGGSFPVGSEADGIFVGGENNVIIPASGVDAEFAGPIRHIRADGGGTIAGAEGQGAAVIVVGKERLLSGSDQPVLSTS